MSDEEHSTLVQSSPSSSPLPSINNDSDEEQLYGAQPFLFEPEVTDSSSGSSSSSESDDQDSPESSRLGNTNWCNCGHCVPMPTAIECVCCCEIQEVQDKKSHVTQSSSPVKCITDHPCFDNVCLDMWVLQTAYYVYCQHYGSSARHGSLHEQLRYTAYRQLVSWCWRWLGRHNRVVLPACAVNKIREQFPSQGNYVGFKI